MAGSASTTKGGLGPHQLVEQLVTAVEDYHYCITTRALNNNSEVVKYLLAGVHIVLYGFPAIPA